MRILFLAPFAHLPGAGHGGSIAGWAQIDALRKAHDVALLSFSESGPYALTDTKDAIDYYAAVGMKHWTVPVRVSRWTLLIARLRALLTGWPADAEVRRSAAMREQLRRAISTFTPNVVIVQFPQMAHYVSECGDVPALMDVHDVASVSSFRAIELGPTLRSRIQRTINWLRWVRYERRFYGRFNAVITLTEQDKRGVTVFSPQICVQSLGLPVQIPVIEREVPRSRVVRFVGNFSHGPNADGLRYFLSRVWPLVRQQQPDATLEIGGRNLPPDLRQRTHEGVTEVGFVADLPHFLSSAAAVVVPLVSGGGVKVKTLEALAAGAAVVTTSVGAEGIDGVSGVHFVKTDDAAEMAAALTSLLDRPDSSTDMRAAAVALMQRDWSPDAWAARFSAFIESALNGKTIATGANVAP